MHFLETWETWPYYPCQTEKPRRQSLAQRAAPAAPPGPQQPAGRQRAPKIQTPHLLLLDPESHRLHEHIRLQIFYSVAQSTLKQITPHVRGWGECQKIQALREWALIIMLDLLHYYMVCISWSRVSLWSVLPRCFTVTDPWQVFCRGWTEFAGPGCLGTWGGCPLSLGSVAPVWAPGHKRMEPPL